LYSKAQRHIIKKSGKEVARDMVCVDMEVSMAKKFLYVFPLMTSHMSFLTLRVRIAKT
jgi:hypothetical protein